MELVKQQNQVAIAETATAAAAAQAEAVVKARYVMALQRPRDWDVVRETLLKECARPAMAAMALYNKPVGDGIVGPSVRLAEAALRAMGNVAIETPAVYDDATKRIVRVTVTDLETNISATKDVTVTKQVERRSLKKGQVPIASRTNSYGDKVYIVEATDDDILNKENALISKTFRTLAFRIFPGALLEEALDVVDRTLKDGAKKDPDGEKRKLLDAFAAIGVGVAAVKTWLGHELEVITPAELVELRGVYQAIKDGEASWQEALDHRQAQRAPATTASSTPAPPVESKGAAGFKAKVGAKKQASAPTITVEATAVGGSTVTPPKDDAAIFSAPPAQEPAPEMSPEEMAEITEAERQREPGEEG